MRQVKITVLTMILWALLFPLPGFSAESAEAESSAEEAAGEEAATDDGLSAAGKASNLWRMRVSKISTLEGRIKDTRQEVQSLIREKNRTEDKTALEGILKKLLVAHKRLKKHIGEYDKIKNELRYRHPEKGEFITRKYLPFRQLSIEQIETEMTLSGRLSQFKRKVDLKYKSLTNKGKGSKKVIKRKISSEKKPKRLVLEK